MVEACLCGIRTSFRDECVLPIPLHNQTRNQGTIEVPCNAPPSLIYTRMYAHISNGKSNVWHSQTLNLQAINQKSLTCNITVVPAIASYPLSLPVGPILANIVEFSPLTSSVFSSNGSHLEQVRTPVPPRH